MAIIVSDTSPIRALHQLGHSGLLELLFGEVLVPPAVVAELAAPRRNFPPLNAANIPGVRIQAPANLGEVLALRRTLDPGESEAIILALELGAQLLIDEAAGRAEARRLGVRPIGVLAVLVRAKQDGHIPAVLPLVERLRDQFGFFLSAPLIQAIREQAGE